MAEYTPPLPQGAGYGVVVGLGAVFAFGMIWVTKLMKKAFDEDNKATETFMVANRSVGTGLTAAAVISSWLYSTALLGSSLLTYKYGLALGVWWGASASIVICILSYIAIETKRRVPNAHTLLELIKTRYGKGAHILWIVYCLLNNTLVFSSMLLGTGTAIASLTGMSVVASIYLLPLGVALYTYFGGLRATFLTDYAHTFIAMIILVWLTIKIIITKEIGSIGALYDAVVAADEKNPIPGNHKGSHLTMTSNESLYFGILHIISNIGAVIMDTGFWQKGFSADVAAAVPGYVLGGVASFSAPWTIGTIGGLAAIALENTPAFPIYPRAMTPEEVTSGLVLPYTIQAVAGKGGAAALLLTIFMASTSIASAQMIAFSSIISFDIYGTYINKNPTDKELIRWSHIGVIITLIFIPTLSTAFHYGKVDMTWLLYILGNIVNGGTFPTLLALLWKGQTKTAAIVSPIVGMICGVSVWLGTAYKYYGEVSIASTGATLPNLFGCVAAFFITLPVSVTISLIKPEEFDWSTFNQIQTVKTEHGSAAQLANREWFTSERVQYMKRMSRWAAFWAIFTIVGHALLWPLAMYGAKMVFSKPFFTAWIVISFIYLWFTLIVGSLYPLYDGGIKSIWIVIKGTTKKTVSSEVQADTGSPASDSSTDEPKGGSVGVKVSEA